jgi:hypothetical protein
MAGVEKTAHFIMKRTIDQKCILSQPLRLRYSLMEPQIAVGLLGFRCTRGSISVLSEAGKQLKSSCHCGKSAGFFHNPVILTFSPFRFINNEKRYSNFFRKAKEGS